ncbi:MAG: hypothetical protein H7195_02180 [Chryseobacterium sp.]|nr:hypothetical protein [Chryseobacterium sp.]
MKAQIKFLFLIFSPLFIFGQKNYDSFLTKDKNVNSYYRRVDSISNIIYDNNNLENLKYSFKYVDNIEGYKNVITADYWANDIKVNFIFKDNNLSFVTPKVFDDFRRQFYQEKKLNVLVYLENKEVNSHFFKEIILNNLNTFYQTENYITTTIFFDDVKRFLIFKYYFENKKLIKIKISELNPEFQWDMINFNEFYYNDNKLIYRKFYQSLMDGQFGLDIKFTDKQIKEMAFKILTDIKK